jgi:outer membrane protein OmpA-like peptidoglycan-associated protein
MRLHTTTALAVLLLACGANRVAAQGIPRSPILDLKSVPDMRAEVDKRYQAALAQTQSHDILAKNDPRYTAATEAKVACGIALGYLKTGTVDPENIGKCDDYARRMTVVPPPPAPPPARPPLPPPPPARRPPPPAPLPPACAIQMPVKIYFDFDADTPSPEARDVLAKVVQAMGACGWSALTVTGHADRAGTDAYNLDLSRRRARNVAALVTANGVPPARITVEAKGETMPAVPTPDGVREPLNRRVEVTATSGR